MHKLIWCYYTTSLSSQIDLALLHYVTFIEPYAIIPTESLSFGLDHFMNKSIELIEEKTKDPFIFLEDNLFAAALLYNKTYEVQSSNR
jgi:hypothetical protein